MNISDYKSRKDLKNSKSWSYTAPVPVTTPPKSKFLAGLNKPTQPVGKISNNSDQPVKEATITRVAQLDEQDLEEEEEEPQRGRQSSMRRELRRALRFVDQGELKRLIPRATTAIVCNEFKRAFKSAMKRNTAEGLRRILKAYDGVIHASTGPNGRSEPPLAPYLSASIGNLPEEAQEKLVKIEKWHQQLLRRWEEKTPNGYIHPEKVYDVYRRHKIHILMKSFLPIGLGLLNLGLFFLFSTLFPPLLILSLFIFIVLGLWIAFNAHDWSNDYLMITDRRVMQVEKVVGLNEEKKEIMIERVDQVHYDANRNIFQFLFRLGRVKITGAGQTQIIFDNLYLPDRIRKEINDAKGGYFIGRNNVRIRRMENKLRNKFLGDPLKEEFDEPPQVDAVPVSELSWFRSFIPKQPIQEGDQVVFHKHPVLLYKNWAKLGVFYILLFVVATLALPRIFALGNPGLSLAGFVFFLVGGTAIIAFSWYLWDEWHNDRFILTRREVMDIYKKPFGLDEEKNVITLLKVQDVRSNRPNFFANFFNFGNVIVTAAGTGEPVIFKNVPDPIRVQAEISRRLNMAKHTFEDNSDRVTFEFFSTFAGIYKDSQRQIASEVAENIMSQIKDYIPPKPPAQ